MLFAFFTVLEQLKHLKHDKGLHIIVDFIKRIYQYLIYSNLGANLSDLSVYIQNRQLVFNLSYEFRVGVNSFLSIPNSIPIPFYQFLSQFQFLWC